MSDLAELKQRRDAAYEQAEREVSSLNVHKLDFDEYQDAVNDAYRKFNRLDSEYRLKTTIFVLSDIPEYGHLMDLSSFIENCKSGGFIDYDGSGNYATASQESDISVHPSDIMKGKYRTDFTHVVWYNK